MTARESALALLRERKQFRKGSLDWEYRTRSARTLIRLAMKIPAIDWRPL